MNWPSVSADARVIAVVPALNETRTVAEVVRVLKGVKSIAEVIVVDDGSSDLTAAEAHGAGADRVVKLETNIGKGGALKRGVDAAEAEILFFCDADFIGLTPDHVERLIEPVKAGRLAMCTGLRDRGPFLTSIIRRLPLLSGERALRREIIDGVPERFLRGFRVELALNWFCRVNRLPYGPIPTLGVGQLRKMQKAGVTRGLIGYLTMSWQLADAFLTLRLARNEFLK
jgi:glycosyltransferase involved in cell wall biosynthesis